MMFASAYRKGMTEEKILITTTVDNDNVTIRINADDALTVASLIEVFKKNLIK